MKISKKAYKQLVTRLYELEQMARTQFRLESQYGPLLICSLEELSERQHDDHSQWIHSPIRLVIKPPEVSGYMQYVMKVFSGELDG